jgi:hypothetical protein
MKSRISMGRMNNPTEEGVISNTDNRNGLKFSPRLARKKGDIAPSIPLPLAQYGAAV